MSEVSRSGSDLLRALAQEFVERQRRGERPSVSEYAKRYPELAEQIRNLFPTLWLDDSRPRSDDVTAPFPGRSPHPRLERLGEYRILREVGRGGMGIVYEAEQLSLGRHVALKVLSTHGLLAPTFLERFRLEARAAAKLHHTNIVPVFGVGEAEGVHYYAMQFIHGQGLDQVLRDLRRLRNHPPAPVANPTEGPGQGGAGHLWRTAEGLLSGQFREGTPPFDASTANLATEAVSPLPPTSPATGLSVGGSESAFHRGVARIGLQAAEALAYAHRQGILHRDIKPSNLLLDLQGTLWITDFGLAKAEGNDELTQTGDIVGTVRYMAPERFEGHSLPQSDVYSLGLTLYELLILKPAFSDANKARLIDRVLHESPELPRKIDPRIPRDLETIVLKCLAKPPAERYPTADALADDLRRFLADRPIKARRSGPLERLARWCRRNPAVATLSAVLLLLLSTIAVGGVWLSVSRGRALADLRQAQDERNRKLFESHVSAADARRMIQRPGQRFGTLKLIREALAVSRETGLSEEDRQRLRNIAIAALCLPDMEPGAPWPGDPTEPIPEGFDPTLRWEIQMRARFRQLPQPAYWFSEPPASPNGRFLAASDINWHPNRHRYPAKLYRLDGSKPVLVRAWPEGFLLNASFRADNRQVAFPNADGTISLHDTATGNVVRRLRPGGNVFHLAYHPRLPRLAASSGNNIDIWDVETGKKLQRLPHTQGISAIAWHPRGHRLATTTGKVIHLWDVATGQQVTAPWTGHRTAGIKIAFNKAGDRLLGNDWGNILRLWDSGTGRLLLSLPGYTGLAAFASDDRSLSGGLRLATGKEMRRIHRPTPGGPERFVNFSLHPNERLLAASTATGLAFLDLATGEQLAFVPGDFCPHAGFAQGMFSRNLRFDSTGALWTVGNAGLLRWPVLFSASTPHRLKVGPPERVAPVLNDGHDGFGTSDDGRVVAVPQYSRGARLIHRGPPRRELQLAPQIDVRWVFVRPDGRRLITGTHQGIRRVRYKLWDTATGRLLANLPYPEVETFHRFSWDSRWIYVTGKENRRLEVASLEKGPLLADDPNAVPGRPAESGWRSEKTRVAGAFSPDNRLAAFGREDGSIQLVLPETDQEVARLFSPEVGRIYPSIFTRDGSQLLALGEESRDLYVFDLRRIREQLAEMDLDWEPVRKDEGGRMKEEAKPKPPSSFPEVEVKGGSLAANWQTMSDAVRRRATARLVFNPFDPEGHYDLGLSLLEAGADERAHTHLGAALAFRPGLTAALKPRAIAAHRLQRWAEAHADYTVHLAGDANDAEGHYYRALIALARGRPGEAIADCRASLQLNPRQSGPHQLLARIHANGPAEFRDLPRAISHAQSAVSLSPTFPANQHALGVVQVRRGQWKEAVAALEKARQLRKSQEAREEFFLALSRARLGELPRAREHFRTAVRLVADKKGGSPAAVEELNSLRAEVERALGMK